MNSIGTQVEKNKDRQKVNSLVKGVPRQTASCQKWQLLWGPV